MKTSLRTQMTPRDGRVRRSARKSRRGAMTIEALLSLFVLTIGALAVANFTIVSLKLTALQTAVVAGARQAALANLTVPRADATFAVMQPICSAHGISDLSGKATLSFSTSGSGQLVVVCEIGVSDCGVPNWLAPFGFSWTGRVFHVVGVSQT